MDAEDQSGHGAAMRTSRRHRLRPLPILAALLALLVGVGWALSSPLSPSPDDTLPLGYHWVRPLLIGPDAELAAVLIRILNTLLGVVLIASLHTLAPRDEQRAVLLVPLIAWTPMGLYLIASDNPTSWAVVGLYAYNAGMYLATRAQGRRRVGLLVTGALGALMCMAARDDVALFLLLVGIALLLAVRWTRGVWPELLITVAFGVLGLLEMLSFGGTETMPGAAPDGTEGGVLHRLLIGIMTIPKYIGGFWGVHWGPGRGDVSLDPRSPYVLVMLAVGALILLALRSGTWRTWLSTLVLIGTGALLPVVLYAGGVFEPLEAFEARYVLPLLAPALLMLLIVDKDEPVSLSRPQAIWTGACVITAHVIAQQVVLMHYVKGDPQWSGDLPISPMMLLFITSCAFAVLTAVVLVNVTRPARDGRTAREGMVSVLT
ncbi:MULTISPECIES: DUF2142 domain-containing protein [Actinomyces]|uniref:Beta-carotene 15,15'-monooxygenase n=1 Tax=Actinomyces respiraculi TaxID=2744574 RepID=A0A7T0PXG5_9ACTO|nr:MULTISPECIES: hypothetical protein [Actinomyces]QPL05825.1 hypothetical protein ID810_02315 [Actinomyces respiraculi]